MEDLERKGVYVVSAPVMALLLDQFERVSFPLTDKEKRLVHRAFPKTKKARLQRVRVSYEYEQTGRR